MDYKDRYMEQLEINKSLRAAMEKAGVKVQPESQPAASEADAPAAKPKKSRRLKRGDSA